MKKKLMILLLSLSLLIISGCSSTKVNNSNTQVKGLTLKLSLIRVASDVYSVNVGYSNLFTKDIYEKQGEYGIYYYEWLKDTYSSMESDMKRRLIRIFENVEAYPNIVNTISLDDDVDVKEVVQTLITQEYMKDDEMQREDIDIFFNHFYEEYLEDFIKENNKEIEKSKNELNSFLAKENVDIFEFMEEESGIEFKKDYKAVFYFDLPPIGAMGFDEGDVKISTISPGTNKENLLGAPFHEYSHELFRTFTQGDSFAEIADKLRDNKKLIEGFEDGAKNGYDWVGWCEENLVDGFAKYLEYKYYDKKDSHSTYAYDLMFCEYLIENNFDPKEKSLEDISMEFYEKVLDENL